MSYILMLEILIEFFLSRYIVTSSVADPNPDPSDPNVFGPPGSRSGSDSLVWIRIWILLSPIKNSKKNLDSNAL